MSCLVPNDFIRMVSDPKFVIVELQTVCKSHLSSPHQWSQTLCVMFSIIELDGAYSQRQKTSLYKSKSKRPLFYIIGNRNI